VYIAGEYSSSISASVRSYTSLLVSKTVKRFSWQTSALTKSNVAEAKDIYYAKSEILIRNILGIE
jgi:hypothetical protein